MNNYGTTFHTKLDTQLAGFVAMTRSMSATVSSVESFLS